MNSSFSALQDERPDYKAMKPYIGIAHSIKVYAMCRFD